MVMPRGYSVVFNNVSNINNTNTCVDPIHYFNAARLKEKLALLSAYGHSNKLCKCPFSASIGPNKDFSRNKQKA